VALTKSQEAIWQKARSLGAGTQGISLTDEICAYLVGRIAKDLEVQDRFPEIPRDLPAFFTNESQEALVLLERDGTALFERLVDAVPDADTYFACLAALHKARLKYERILATQPKPTLEQVGPRALLQYGKITGRALASLLFWRKWFFDIDNRAGQETGYLFEPVIAYAIGGTPAPAAKSPVRRHRNRSKGRQVDCLLDDRAYELKIRVTIAASGQGRWQEELDFPLDCRKSGFKPILVCMDATANPKLEALAEAFLKQKGEVYIGQAAWDHLEGLAGHTMSKFLELYVRGPIQSLLEDAGDTLLDLSAYWHEEAIDIEIGDEVLHIDRLAEIVDDAEEDEMPSDADDLVPGS